MCYAKLPISTVPQFTPQLKVSEDNLDMFHIAARINNQYRTYDVCAFFVSTLAKITTAGADQL